MSYLSRHDDWIEDLRNCGTALALRVEFTRRKRQRTLVDLLDHLAEERGRLDTPEDEAEIARYMRLLGGVVRTRRVAEPVTDVTVDVSCLL